jgi:hypothetical protein
VLFLGFCWLPLLTFTGKGKRSYNDEICSLPPVYFVRQEPMNFWRSHYYFRGFKEKPSFSNKNIVKPSERMDFFTSSFGNLTTLPSHVLHIHICCSFSISSCLSTNDRRRIRAEPFSIRLTWLSSLELRRWIHENESRAINISTIGSVSEISFYWQEKGWLGKEGKGCGS